MIQQTSITSYYQEVKAGLAGRQQLVYEALRLHPDSTDREVAALLQASDPNQVRPRRNELAQAGRVYASGKRKCMVTGKMSLVWRVV